MNSNVHSNIAVKCGRKQQLEIIIWGVDTHNGLALGFKFDIILLDLICVINPIKINQILQSNQIS